MVRQRTLTPSFTGSTPVSPAYLYGDVSSDGRTSDCGSEGDWFDPSTSHHQT